MAKVDKCTNCHHDCHCEEELHADEYGVCTCEYCNCKTKADNKTWENEVEYE